MPQAALLFLCIVLKISQVAVGFLFIVNALIISIFDVKNISVLSRAIFLMYCLFFGIVQDDYDL